MGELTVAEARDAWDFWDNQCADLRRDLKDAVNQRNRAFASLGEARKREQAKSESEEKPGEEHG